MHALRASVASSDRAATPTRATRLQALLVTAGLLALAGCGPMQPGAPGREPSSAGRYNPVSGEVNTSGR